MSVMSERVNAPVSSQEMARRWAGIREAMKRDALDMLVLQNNSDSVGGYVKYATDVSAGNYGTTVLIPCDDEMTLITHGPADGDRQLPAEGDGFLRGVKRVLTSPYVPSVPYTAGAAADLALRALAGYERATIGLVGTAQMSLAFGERLKSGLPTARFVEASELMDRIKAIKSEEEQQLIRSCAHLQDTAMMAALNAIEPGMRESDVAAVVNQVGSGLGSEAGIVMVGSGPVGDGWGIMPRHLQNRIIRDGDMVAILVEINGPGGLFTELGRTAILGDVPEHLEEELGLVLEAQRFTLDRLVPGARCSDIWEQYNSFLRDNGRPLEARIHCHGQGTDLVERPIIGLDETMTIEAGMNITCHPMWVHDGLWSWTCDNYLIGPDGPGECLHALSTRIFAL